MKINPCQPIRDHNLFKGKSVTEKNLKQTQQAIITCNKVSAEKHMEKLTTTFVAGMFGVICTHIFKH